ncbi:MAG: hypothetical protein C4527_06065 [Candidatus Omnitrophota bacterium]|jgi:hypothetical protein|nr:MAG: hypothetical protein C4527_06065 [Candidatus Omnitrophota bacterium]
MRNRLSHLYFLFILFIGGNGPFAGELLPFSLPWDDGSDSITNVNHLLEKPAGKNGFVRIENGRFVDGAGKRFRVLGVNTAFDGNFPSHEQAEKVAARMAKFGINCVRFHHLDTSRSPRGIWQSNTPEKQWLDAERLDRLDYFIHQLKLNGIYANINLKVGRKTVEADGLPDADKLPGYDKGPDHYHPRLIELQKNYARDLLTHTNPYTHTRYVEEPAVAFIEINNESGLVNKWNGGDLDRMPPLYLESLQTDWNAFLRNKYGATETLREAWKTNVSGLGNEQLVSPLDGWTFQQIEEGKGTKEIVREGPDGEDCLKITTTATGSQGWHVQLFYPGLSSEKGGTYRFQVWMRADRTRDISIGMQMNHSPWTALDHSAEIDATREWKLYELVFAPSQSDRNVRLNISDLGDELGILWIARPSMIVGSPEGLAENETLRDESVSVILRNEYGKKGQAAKRDWMGFLVERETEYYRDMVEYLKNNLGVKSLIGGTQLGFGTYVAQMECDFIDHHAYWQHPVFPGRAWDSNNWFVRNLSILNASDNPLERLMLARVADRAYTVSEYNHPAPNTYCSEVVPLLCAYAALQDWDGIYFFAYSHSDNYERKSINNFFDIAGHTPKMLAMAAAANMYLRGDVSPANDAIIGGMSRDRFVDVLTERGGSLWNINNQITNLPGAAPYLHRTAIAYGDHPEPEANPSVSGSRRRLESDTGELVWDNSAADKSYALIRAEKTKGFVGFVDQRNFDLGNGVRLEIGKTRQDWANVLLTSMRSEEHGSRWLLTATGYAENQGMQWTDENQQSVGRNWGEGPPLVEPIPLRLTFANTENHPRIHALDEWGARTRELEAAVSANPENEAVIDLISSQPSLWYEIVFEEQAVLK